MSTCTTPASSSERRTSASRSGRAGVLIDWGLTDLFRQQHPEAASVYSWWDYRAGDFHQGAAPHRSRARLGIDRPPRRVGGDRSQRAQGRQAERSRAGGGRPPRVDGRRCLQGGGDAGEQPAATSAHPALCGRRGLCASTGGWSTIVDSTVSGQTSWGGCRPPSRCRPATRSAGRGRGRAPFAAPRRASLGGGTTSAAALTKPSSSGVNRRW